MSLSNCVPTLPIHGEPEDTPAIRPEGLVATYSHWVDKAEALIAARSNETMAYDDLIVTVGRYYGIVKSYRKIEAEIKASGKPMPVAKWNDKTKAWDVKRMYPSHTTVQKWVVTYLLMTEGDVTSDEARKMLKGMGNDGYAAPGAVLTAITEAAASDKDVVKAVTTLTNAAERERTGKAKAPKEEQPYSADDATKDVKKLNEILARLAQHPDVLTPEHKGGVATAKFTAESIIG
jgi:hypothetical protein